MLLTIENMPSYCPGVVLVTSLSDILLLQLLGRAALVFHLRGEAAGCPTQSRGSLPI